MISNIGWGRTENVRYERAETLVGRPDGDSFKLAHAKRLLDKKLNDTLGSSPPQEFELDDVGTVRSYLADGAGLYLDTDREVPEINSEYLKRGGPFGGVSVDVSDKSYRELGEAVDHFVDYLEELSDGT